MLRKTLAGVALVLSVVLASSSAAMAGPDIDRAAAGLRTTPVYVDPAAKSHLPDAAAARVLDHIRKSNTVIFVAVLPDDVKGEASTPDDLVKQLGAKAGLNGTLAVVANKTFDAGSSVLPGGVAKQLSQLAFATHKKQGVEATIHDFIARVASYSNRDSTIVNGRQVKVAKKHKSHVLLILILLLVGAILIGLIIWMITRRADYKSRKRRLRARIDNLSADINGWRTSDVQEAEDAFATASSSYSIADADLGSAHNQRDLDGVEEQVKYSESAMKRAKRAKTPVKADSSYLHTPAPAPKGVAREEVGTRVAEGRPAPTDRTVRENVPAPSGHTTINNYNNTGDPGYWYGGGWRDGRYFYPGYYGSMNYWEGVWLGEMLAGHDYDRGYDRGYDAAERNNQDYDPGANSDWGSDSNDNTPGTGSSDWSSSGDSDYGSVSESSDSDYGSSSGSDWSSSSDSDSGSSSGSDWGSSSGSDYGPSSGSDWGGGSDSGGGDSGGGGDW